MLIAPVPLGLSTKYHYFYHSTIQLLCNMYITLFHNNLFPSPGVHMFEM